MSGRYGTTNLFTVRPNRNSVVIMIAHNLVQELVSGYAEPERGWRRIMCLQAYIDDSGSEPSSPAYVLGGIVLPAGWWCHVSQEWRSVLQTFPPIEYYKGSEVWDREKGQFARLSDDDRRAKVEALADVICEYHPMAFSLSLRWDDFREFSKDIRLDPDKSNPYFFLFYGVVAFMAIWGKKEENFTAVDCIFDNQNSIGEKARNWYEFFKQKTTNEIQATLGKKPEFADEKVVLPLQSADMFAWYRRRDVAGALCNSWNQGIWQRLSQYHHSVVMEPSHLMKMARDLDIIKL